jgi:hypothetical protein
VGHAKEQSSKAAKIFYLHYIKINIIYKIPLLLCCFAPLRAPPHEKNEKAGLKY